MELTPFKNTPKLMMFLRKRKNQSCQGPLCLGKRGQSTGQADRGKTFLCTSHGHCHFSLHSPSCQSSAFAGKWSFPQNPRVSQSNNNPLPETSLKLFYSSWRGHLLPTKVTEGGFPYCPRLLCCHECGECGPVPVTGVWLDPRTFQSGGF